MRYEVKGWLTFDVEDGEEADLQGALDLTLIDLDAALGITDRNIEFHADDSEGPVESDS